MRNMLINRRICMLDWSCVSQVYFMHTFMHVSGLVFYNTVDSRARSTFHADKGEYEQDDREILTVKDLNRCQNQQLTTFITVTAVVNTHGHMCTCMCINKGKKTHTHISGHATVSVTAAHSQTCAVLIQASSQETKKPGRFFSATIHK